MQSLVLILILVGGLVSGHWSRRSLAHGSEQSNLIELQFSTMVPFPLPSTWRGLVPLRTTRSGVERLLGQPKIHIGQQYVYENDTERVDVRYSLRRCEPGVRWNVAQNVVISIDVSPNKTLLLEDLTFDKRKYVRQEWSHPSDWVTYRNQKDGIWIETTSLDDKTELVRSITYLPKTKDKKLKCKEPLKVWLPSVQLLQSQN
jgi:hypothetical protein